MPTLTEQETIEQAVIGKRIIAVSWLPVPNFDGLLSLESITLEGGLKLDIWASDHGNIVSVDLVGGQHADI